jgi:hypothetical protein
LLPRSIRADGSHAVRRRKSTRPGWNGGAHDFMRRVLQTERTEAGFYRQRGQLIEPIFGQTKHNLYRIHAAAERPSAPNGA